MAKRISAEEKGYRLGVATCVGFLVHGHGYTGVALEMMQVHDLTLAKARTADATEYDISAIRRALRYG